MGPNIETVILYPDNVLARLDCLGRIVLPVQLVILGITVIIVPLAMITTSTLIAENKETKASLITFVCQLP